MEDDSRAFEKVEYKFLDHREDNPKNKNVTYNANDGTIESFKPGSSHRPKIGIEWEKDHLFTIFPH